MGAVLSLLGSGLAIPFCLLDVHSAENSRNVGSKARQGKEVATIPISWLKILYTLIKELQDRIQRFHWGHGTTSGPCVI